MSKIIDRNFESEIQFKSSRSSGPGGQNVNKVNSRVELRFHINSSNLLSEKEKVLVHKFLMNRITIDGELLIVAQDERSQVRNKEIVINRFYALLEKALKPQKKRFKTKPTRASRLKRLENKKYLSYKKRNRQSPNE